MPEDVNFVDLVALTRIAPDTVVEKFGSVINSSFFDASNILATLKQKGLVDFTTSFPGQSAISVTELGKQTVSDANEKAKANFDALDYAIVTQLSGGKRAINDLTGALNIRPRDLAMHLYRLSVQQYLAYDLRNGIVDLSLTEKGFMRVKEGMVPSQPAQAANAAQPAEQEKMLQPGVAMGSASMQQPQAQAAGTAAQPGQPAGATIDMKELETRLAGAKKRKIIISAVAAVVIIVIVVIALTMLNIVKL